MLLLLPEEVDSRHLRLGANRRSQIKAMLTSSSPHVHSFLQSVLQQPEPGLEVARQVTGLLPPASYLPQVSCVKCYSSWLTLGCIPLNSVQASPVMVSGLLLPLLLLLPPPPGPGSLRPLLSQSCPAPARGCSRLYDSSAHQVLIPLRLPLLVTPG